VTNPDQPGWNWEQTDVRRSGSSGDVAKLFKNEGTKQPGVFAVGAPRPEATLMAREVIQNSWDAARELRADIGEEAPEFEIEFTFREHAGAVKQQLVRRLDLGGLREQLQEIVSTGDDARSKIGLGGSNCLDLLDAASPLRLLTIVERGTTGMYGPFIQAKSKLYLALISIGYTMKAAGSGGSYGYGKAGLIAASATRTVVAYTCFRERDDDPGVTRRLLGMTYWGQHEVGGNSYTGFARFGQQEDGWVRPFTNQDADEVAVSLGLDVRDPARLNDLGTTFIVVDPDIDPSELSVAIGRNWWPAMLDESFHPVVRRVDASGTPERFDIKPRQDPILRSFIRGWELATTPQDNVVTAEYRRDLGTSSAATGSMPLGMIGLTADLGGWSYAQPSDVEQVDEDEGTTASHASLVALVRGPRMVVEYYPQLPSKQPFVRGVFVASDDELVDDLLRQTEPKAHDAWSTKSTEEGVDSRAPAVADAILKKVRASVREFQKRLKPPAPDPGDIRLPVFQNLFRDLLTGKGRSTPKPPPSGQRDVSLRVQQHLEVAPGSDDLMLRATVELSLSSNYTKADEATVITRISYKFLEDGAAGQKCSIEVSPPSEFSPVGEGVFAGSLSRTPVAFTIVSEPYSSDWSGRLLTTCEVLGPGSPSDPSTVEDGGA
jgi:hypothetical protein